MVGLVKSVFFKRLDVEHVKLMSLFSEYFFRPFLPMLLSILIKPNTSLMFPNIFLI